MADIQLDTLEGKMTIMKSATEGLGIAMFDHLGPSLKNVVDNMTDLISATTEWLEIPTSEKLQEEKGHIGIQISPGDITDPKDVGPVTRDESDLEFRRMTLTDEGQQLYNLYLKVIQPNKSRLAL